MTDGYGLLQEVEFLEGEPDESGAYLVARYRRANRGRDSNVFLDVTTLHWDNDSRQWLVNWESDHFIDVRYYAYLPTNPEVG